jgi:hypothetical protein
MPKAADDIDARQGGSISDCPSSTYDAVGRVRRRIKTSRGAVRKGNVPSRNSSGYPKQRGSNKNGNRLRLPMSVGAFVWRKGRGARPHFVVLY